MIKKLLTVFIINSFILAFAAEAIEMYEVKGSDSSHSVSKNITSSTNIMSESCGDCHDDCHKKESHCIGHCFGLHHLILSNKDLDLIIRVTILKDTKWAYKFLYGPPPLRSEIKPPVHS
jgi:hypothetical protein